MNVSRYYIFMKHKLHINGIVLIEGIKIHSKIPRFFKSQKISINVDYRVGSYFFFIGMQVLTNTSFLKFQLIGWITSILFQSLV
jgi:hypothetical protein